jgi:hypothetical protein
MSRGYTFVKADDNNFYRGALIERDDFFLCFDEDDPPELVIRINDRSEEELYKRAEEIIKELGIEASIEKVKLYPGFESHRVFGKKNKMAPAYAVFLKITKPIPLSIITKHDGVYDGKGEGTFECFEDLDLKAWRKEKFGLENDKKII